MVLNFVNHPILRKDYCQFLLIIILEILSMTRFEAKAIRVRLMPR